MLSFRGGSGKSVWKLSSHRIGVVMILFSFMWGLYLIKIQLDERRNHSYYLKEQIIELSKRYVRALAKEKTFDAIDGQKSAVVNDMKRATAVLLQNMLDRIQHLEQQVEVVITNSTAEFATLSRQIRYLNTSMSKLSNVSHRGWTDECFVQYDPRYPDCQKKFEWLLKNWKTDPKYAAVGVNGSRCSVIYYLSEVENVCPKVGMNSCSIPNDPGYPHCKEKVEWMQKFWKSDNKFAVNGVDGSLCSFIIYLSEVETWCPMLRGRSKISDCAIPLNNPAYPICHEKIGWMRNFWQSDACYAKDYGVNGTICSFIYYLSMAEHWCPPPEGASGKILQTGKAKAAFKPILNRNHANHLLNLMTDKNPMKFKWMRSRVFRMWPEWQAAYKNIDLTNTVRKKILVHIGVLARESAFHFGELAFKGGPLGELVQWTDLIVALYLLGHDVTVTADEMDMTRALGTSGLKKRNCPALLKDDFDLVFMDYYGLKQVMTKVGNLLPQYKCKLRIVDSFGTEAQFNYIGFKEAILGGSMSLWGRHNLNLRQFLTMFPHSPDNTFLGFVVGEKLPKNVTAPKKKKTALVYGKHYYMWKDMKSKSYLKLISKYTEIHGTIGGLPADKLSEYVPSFVKNHGVLKSADLKNLLRESLVFVGLGFPYEGPAALEAIANGCFFINPKFKPPKNRLNEKFFKDKPTLRLLSSQHPYAEEFIGKPYVYTVDINSEEEVKKTMEEIVNQKPLKPYLPLEYTHEGMLERLNAILQNQDFCNKTHLWPPINNLITKTVEVGMSCKDICHNQGLVCEPEFFPFVNTAEELTRNGFPCNDSQLEFTPSLVAPGFRPNPAACLIQTQPLLYSCTAKSETTRRLCPCREFKKEQIQLCKTC